VGYWYCASIKFVTEWTYNLADLPVTMKYPDGEEVTTQYNNNMQPINIAGTDNYVPSMTYDSAGRMTSRALGNGLTQTYDYYDWSQQGGRLETLVTGSLQNLAYVYDPVGNISQIANSVAGETNTYVYDALDRLTDWTLNSVTEEYNYDDDTGNLIDKNGLLLDYPVAIGSSPTHPHAVTSANASVYAYDANGNQTTRTFGSDHFDLVYDAENRLVEVQKNDATIALFTFDGDGKRVKSVMDGETILFAGGHYEKKGSTITKYYFAGASRVAMRKYTIPQNMTVEYMLGDHLGSTSLTTDANGVKISELRYKPWGETRYEWTDAPATTPTYELTKYQYTGQYSDSYIKLLFYGSRHYDPELGRFIQPDSIVPNPANSQSWDRYSYVWNNPVRFTDPDGHWPTCWSGVRCTTPIADQRDLTTWLVAAAVDIAESAVMQSVQDANSEFRKLDAKALFESVTRDGAMYDVKDKTKEQLNGGPIKIGKNWYEYSTVGNILFGFYGKAAGWSDTELYLGAGIAQMEDVFVRGEGDLGPFFGDTTDDHFAIGFGIYLYENYYGDGVLTESELLDALENYGYAYAMALEPQPAEFLPRYYDYPVDRFYHDEVDAE
jgi:RHS repeat-associated protein